jgi:hypothetical protein
MCKLPSPLLFPVSVFCQDFSPSFSRKWHLIPVQHVSDCQHWWQIHGCL